MRTPTVFKRKRLGLTDYRKRYRLVKSDIPRLVVRPSGKGGTVQLVRFDPSGDRVLKTVTPSNLVKEGLSLKRNNTSVFYLMGFSMGKYAVSAGIDQAILDTGRHVLSKGGKITATIKGFVDAGGNLPHDESILPDDGRIQGKHLKSKKAQTSVKEGIKKLEEKA